MQVSRHQAVLDYLEQNGQINKKEAEQMGVKNLSHVIGILRKMGVGIESVSEPPSGRGRPSCRYKLTQ